MSVFEGGILGTAYNLKKSVMKEKLYLDSNFLLVEIDRGLGGPLLLCADPIPRLELDDLGPEKKQPFFATFPIRSLYSEFRCCSSDGAINQPS